MNTLFRESFDADLSVITDAGLLRRIKKVIEQVEAARTFQQNRVRLADAVDWREVLCRGRQAWE